MQPEEDEEAVQRRGGLSLRSSAQHGLTARVVLLSSVMDEPNILRRRGLQVNETDADGMIR